MDHITKIFNSFNLPNLFGNQSSLLLFSLLVTTILIIGFVVLFLRNFLCWYLKIDEINKQLITIKSDIHSLKYKLDLIKINSNKKIIPPNYIKIKPETVQEKKPLNSNSRTLDQNQKKREIRQE